MRSWMRLIRKEMAVSEADYEAALLQIDALMENDPEPTSTEGEDLELLCLLVGRYEEERYPMNEGVSRE